MWAVSQRFTEATRVSREIRTALSVTPVDGAARQIGFGSGSVTLAGGTGMRYTANLAVSALSRSAAGAAEAFGNVPASSGDIVGAERIYPLISAEGSVFELEHGFKYGTDSELVPMGVLEAASAPGPLFGSTYPLRLTDRWASLEEAEYTAPYQPPRSSRASIIASAVSSALPVVEVINRSARGGTNDGSGVWERSRTALIRDMARDGGLECYFDGLGRFIIRDEPAVTGTPADGQSVFVLTTGAVGTILDAERDRPLTKRYNAVVARPSPDQSWPQQVAQVADISHPRHRSKIGVRPLFIDVPSAGTAQSARHAANARLQRIIKPATLRRVRALANPALEPGDIGVLSHSPTPTDTGLAENVMVAEVAFNLLSGDMDVSLVGAGVVDVEGD